MTNKNNTICIDILTNVFIKNKNIGYSDFDVRLSKKELLEKIKNLEFTFGKAMFCKSLITFSGERKNQNAKLFIDENDLRYIEEEYLKRISI